MDQDGKWVVGKKGGWCICRHTGWCVGSMGSAMMTIRFQCFYLNAEHLPPPGIHHRTCMFEDSFVYCASTFMYLFIQTVGFFWFGLQKLELLQVGEVLLGSGPIAEVETLHDIGSVPVYPSRIRLGVDSILRYIKLSDIS